MNNTYKVSQNIQYQLYLFIDLVKSKIGEKELNEFLEMQGKLGSLVKEVKNIVESADIKVDDLKELLILSYPFEEEIEKAENLFRVFVAIRKLCSPVNICILELIADHFKLSDALGVIQDYKIHEQNYRKKLMSATFAKELKEEVELLSRNLIPECTITLKLKWSRAKPSTVKEFEIVINNVFLDYSQYIHIYEVAEGCVIVTMHAPKPLMGALVKMAKIRLSYLLDIGVILLQIGDEVILDKREKEV